jgi:hypothetical protein
VRQTRSRKGPEPVPTVRNLPATCTSRHAQVQYRFFGSRCSAIRAENRQRQFRRAGAASFIRRSRSAGSKGSSSCPAQHAMLGFDRAACATGRLNPHRSKREACGTRKFKCVRLVVGKCRPPTGRKSRSKAAKRSSFDVDSAMFNHCNFGQRVPAWSTCSRYRLIPYRNHFVFSWRY